MRNPLPLAERLKRVSASQTQKVLLAVEGLRREGVHVIDLGAGEPDFATPAHIRAAAVEAIEAGHHVLLEKPMALTVEASQGEMTMLRSSGVLMDANSLSRMVLPSYASTLMFSTSAGDALPVRTPPNSSTTTLSGASCGGRRNPSNRCTSSFARTCTFRRTGRNWSISLTAFGLRHQRPRRCAVESFS